MPVALTDLGDNHGYVMGGGGQLPYPEAAAVMFDVINLWSQIDMNLALVISKVVGADPAAAMAMYQAVSGAEQKAKQLRAAMLLRVDTVTNDVVLSVIDSCEPSKKIRNMFAHDLWGYLTPPDGRLVSMAPAAYAKVYARPVDTNIGIINRLRDDLSSQTLVWEQAEIVAAALEARRCHGMVGRFTFLFGHPSTLDMMGRLLAEADVRDRFVKKMRRWSSEDLNAACEDYQLFDPGPARSLHGEQGNAEIWSLLCEERRRRE